MNRVHRNIEDEELAGNSPCIRVGQANGEHGVYAVEAIAPGQILMRIQGERRDRPSRYSVQMGWNLHIDVNETLSMEELMDRFPWRFLNHSCDGNTRIQGNCLIALRPICPGEEVTFNYNTTEYEMASPFTCHCGSPFCIGEIRGYKFLARSERERLQPLLSLHLQSCPDMSRIASEDPVLP